MALGKIFPFFANCFFLGCHWRKALLVCWKLQNYVPVLGLLLLITTPHLYYYYMYGQGTMRKQLDHVEGNNNGRTGHKGGTPVLGGSAGGNRGGLRGLGL